MDGLINTGLFYLALIVLLFIAVIAYNLIDLLGYRLFLHYQQRLVEEQRMERMKRDEH